MYTGYLFIIAFAVLITSTACHDVNVKSNGDQMSLATDDVCRTAGFVKNTAKTVNTGSDSTAATTKMSTADIILTVLGVTAGILILGFVGSYYSKKCKVN